MDFLEILKNAVHLPTMAITAFLIQVIILPIRYKLMPDGTFVKRKKMALYTPLISLVLGVGLGALLSFIWPEVSWKLGAFSGTASVFVLCTVFDLGAGLIKGRKV